MAGPSERGARGQAWVMLAVLAVGFGLGVATLSSAGPRLRLGQAMTPAAFLSGGAAAAVNYAMAHDLPIGGALSAAGGVLRWRLFDSGGPLVTVGCRGWLYLTEELRPWPGGDAAMAARAQALHAVAAGLAARGVALRIALIPDKARIQATGRCGAPYSVQSQARYAAFAAMLAGLPWTDVRTAYDGVRTPVYYRTDTHWNQDGAAIAAAAIGSAIDAPIGRDRPFHTAYGAEIGRAGDLLRLMGLDHAPDLLRPRPDRERPATTAETDPAPDTGGLLDAAPVPEVALIGSSYSVNGNFHGALEQTLATPVSQFAQEGGGFWRAARDYFRGEAFRETPPKLVVWEIPERVVNQPIGDEEATFLHDWQGR